MRSLIIQTWQRNRLFMGLCFFWLLTGIGLLLIIPKSRLFLRINQWNSSTGDNLMTALSAFGRGDCIAIVLVMLLLLPCMRYKTYVLAGILYGLLIPLLNYYGKQVYADPRPLSLLVDEKIHTVPWLSDLYNNSFPSGHTMGAFGFFLLLNHFVPLRKWWMSVIFFLFAFGCGYSRIYLGQHFFADVMAGSVVGIACTFVVLVCASYFTQKKEEYVEP